MSIILAELNLTDIGRLVCVTEFDLHLYWPRWPLLTEFVKISPVYDWYDVHDFCHINTV